MKIANIFALRAGFEPTTNWLTANCSTTEPPKHIVVKVGLEPTTSCL